MGGDYVSTKNAPSERDILKSNLADVNTVVMLPNPNLCQLQFPYLLTQEKSIPRK